MTFPRILATISFLLSIANYQDARALWMQVAFFFMLSAIFEAIKELKESIQ